MVQGRSQDFRYGGAKQVTRGKISHRKPHPPLKRTTLLHIFPATPNIFNVEL